ncbi:MAG: T9SS type A sorting domain-containing protein [Candidatus Cloacimonadaceae bacterium]|nr:T9SS type A sorting domain-containing protein [Candidatus Cloacimonadaceae bacterium]
MANDDPAMPLPQTRVYPNPFSDVVNIKVSPHTSALLSAGIYNLKAQRVKSLPIANLANQEQSLIWDGSDQNGRKVGNGIYYLHLMDGSRVSKHKILYIR